MNPVQTSVLPPLTKCPLCGHHDYTVICKFDGTHKANELLPGAPRPLPLSPFYREAA